MSRSTSTPRAGNASAHSARRLRSGRPRRRSSPSESSPSSVKVRPLRRMPSPHHRTSPRRCRLLQARRSLRARGRRKQSAKPQASEKPGGVTGAKQGTGATRTRTQRKAATGKAKAASQKADAKRQKRTPPAAAAAEPKRFAWAPVEGAVGYRFELFRGDKQVLECGRRLRPTSSRANGAMQAAPKRSRRGTTAGTSGRCCRAARQTRRWCRRASQFRSSPSHSGRGEPTRAEVGPCR